MSSSADACTSLHSHNSEISVSHNSKRSNSKNNNGNNSSSSSSNSGICIQQPTGNSRLRNNQVYPNAANVNSNSFGRRTPINGENWRQNLAPPTPNPSSGPRNISHSYDSATFISGKQQLNPDRVAAAESNASSAASSSSSNSSSNDENSRQQSTMQPLFPVPNSYAFVTASAVILYSATFLLYAQRHRLVLLIMTGLIGVCILSLYLLGILSFIYLMLRIQDMEKSLDGENSKMQNIACITVNNSSSKILSDDCGSTMITIDNRKMNKSASNTTVTSLGSATVMEMKL